MGDGQSKSQSTSQSKLQSNPSHAYKLVPSDGNARTIILVNTFAWMSAQQICAEVHSSGCECFDYHAILRAVNQNDDLVADAEKKAHAMLQDSISKSSAKVIVVVGTSMLGRITPHYSFWLKMNDAELEAEYRQAMEDQVQAVLNNVQRIKNVINTWPVNKVGQGLIQYGLDVDLKTSYKSFVKTYKAMTFLANYSDEYKRGGTLTKKEIIAAIHAICRVNT
jgi:transcriptional regulator with PAS, ATPase and Fis domain